MTNSSSSMALLRSFSTSNRVNARSYIAGLNTLKSSPSSFARYMAVSASLRRSSESWVRASPKEMPMLASTYRSRASIVNGLRWIVEGFDEHGELIPPEASQGILRAQAAPEALGHDREKEVSHVVTEGVVHYLEAIQVHEQHGDPSVPPDGAPQGLPEAVHEELAVGEICQGIVECLVMQALLQGLALGKVVENPLPVEGFARFVLYQHRLLTHPHHRSVF